MSAVVLTIAVHPELRGALKASAALQGADVRMSDRLHELLCRGLGREDLLGSPPPTSKPARRVGRGHARRERPTAHT